MIGKHLVIILMLALLMTLFCDIMNSTLPCYYTTEGIYTDILTTKTQFKPLQANYRFFFCFVSFCFVSFCFANYS